MILLLLQHNLGPVKRSYSASLTFSLEKKNIGKIFFHFLVGRTISSILSLWEWGRMNQNLPFSTLNQWNLYMGKTLGKTVDKYVTNSRNIQQVSQRSSLITSSLKIPTKLWLSNCHIKLLPSFLLLFFQKEIFI